jgi:hypothetical protein
MEAHVRPRLERGCKSRRQRSRIRNLLLAKQTTRGRNQDRARAAAGQKHEIHGRAGMLKASHFCWTNWLLSVWNF